MKVWNIKHILYIDIVNPYIKSLGSTDIMSESDKKTPIVPSDQGATSMTATVVPKELESEWLQFLKQKEEASKYHSPMAPTEETTEPRHITDEEHLEMEAFYNGLVSRMQRNNPVKVDIGLPPNLQEDKGYGIFIARARKAALKTSAACIDTGEILPTISVLRKIGDHVAEIQATIAENSDQTNANSAVARRVAALAKYLGGLPTTEVAAHQIEDSDKKEDKSAAPSLPPSEKDNFAEIEVSLRNQRSWFLKQNEELLKLLDSLHKQEYGEIVQEEEILDRISDFTLVLFEYVKTLKKRKGSGAVCV